MGRSSPSLPGIARKSKRTDIWKKKPTAGNGGNATSKHTTEKTSRGKGKGKLPAADTQNEPSTKMECNTEDQANKRSDDQNGEESMKKEGKHQRSVSEKAKDKSTRKLPEKIVALNIERMAKGTDHSAEDDEDNTVTDRRYRAAEVISPAINGLRQFGISRGVVARAIVKFSGLPEPHPRTACFHFPGTNLTHRHVLDAVRSTAGLAPEDASSVTAIQFVDRNTRHGTRGMDNRWLVTFDAVSARDALVRQGLGLGDRIRAAVRSYDDVLRDEYCEYVEYLEMRRELLLCVETKGSSRMNWMRR